MIRKRTIFISLSILFLVVIALFIYLLTFIQPKIAFLAEITKISDNDYKIILNNKQVKYPSNDIGKFKHISVQCEAVEPFGINSHIKIEKDILGQFLENNKDLQILSGGSFEHSNGKECSENIEIYLYNISENELINILENFKFKITWTEMWGKQNSKIFYLKDYLKYY
jgi:hypothetical protein